MKTTTLFARRFAALALAFVLLSGPLSAQDAEGKLAAWQKDYNRAVQDFTRTLRAARSPEEREQLMERHPGAAYARQLVELAAKHPRTPVAAEALVRAALADQTELGDTAGARAYEALARDHVNSPKLFGLFAAATASLLPASETLLKAVAETSAEPKLQAQALIALANKYKTSNTAQAEEYFRLIGEKFDRERYLRGTMGEHARKEIAYLQKFGVGRPAPDIAGADVDRQPFKLSDYRGKAVLIAFSGDWCGPCRSMYPHERALVTAMKNRPFVLLGVNSDPLERARAVVQRGDITWRLWWDGGSPGGPIAEQWEIHAWPSFVLLDHRGHIRQRWRGVPEPEALHRAVETLVKEAEAAAPPP